MRSSPKQQQIFKFVGSDKDALICDGAIRSGKTSMMFVAFCEWTLRHFDGQTFIVAGKSVESAVRNIIHPFLATHFCYGRYSPRWRAGDHTLFLARNGRTSKLIVFGGKDESSFQLIQGLTAAGCFMDEVALMPRSFFNQCLARVSVDGSKYWMNCNPGSPDHWFKREWIDRADERNAMYLHFELRDNPSLSERVIKRYEHMYAGVFKQRYIDGLWTAAEGIVYDMWDKDRMTATLDHQEREVLYLSIDYGITNPFAALMWAVRDGCAYCIDEYYFDSKLEGRRLTDPEHYDRLKSFIGDRYVDEIIIDPSATSFIELIRRDGRWDVSPADNSVVEGIQHVSMAMSQGKIKIDQKCTGLLSELGQYRWDDKAKGDKVIKDYDHACDAMRYFVQTAGVRLMPIFGAW